MAVDIERLKSLAYFSGLGDDELDSIRKFLFEKNTGRGEIILLEGEPPGDLYFVVSGAVKLLKTSAEGKEQILNIIRPGDSFGDVPIFDGGLNPVSAQAMSPVSLYGMRKSALESVLREHPRVALNVIGVLARQVRHFMSLVEDLSFKHVIDRVAKILLEYAGDGASSRPRLTQQEMAAMAGTAREMIGRSLKALEEDGVIRFDRHRIVIADSQALEEMAGVST